MQNKKKNIFKLIFLFSKNIKIIENSNILLTISYKLQTSSTNIVVLRIVSQISNFININ